MFDEPSWKAQAHPLQQVADDIWQLRLPLPYALDHVNVYLLHGHAGWTIVDCGLNTAQARTLWEGAFKQLHIVPERVEQIVLTHIHPDHFGLSGWLQQRFSTPERQIPVWVSAEEHAFFNSLWARIGTAENEAESKEYYTRCGFPLEEGDKVRKATVRTGEHTLPHPTFSVLDETQPIKMGDRVWQQVPAAGHSDGQVIFYDTEDQVFLSGDQLLMKITPNVGRWPNSEHGVLERYLSSLQELKTFDVRMAFPGHKWLIGDWQQRLAEMDAHHDERLNTTLDAVHETPGIDVNHVSKYVFRLGDLDIHQARFAIAETLAHLDLLQAKGAIQQSLEDGVWRYRVAGIQ